MVRTCLISAEIFRTYQGREVVANSLAGERQELVKVKIVVSHFCCKLDLVVVERWIVVTGEGLESTWPMDMDMTDCGNGLFLYHSRMQHGTQKSLVTH